MTSEDADAKSKLHLAFGRLIENVVKRSDELYDHTVIQSRIDDLIKPIDDKTIKEFVEKLHQQFKNYKYTGNLTPSINDQYTVDYHIPSLHKRILGIFHIEYNSIADKEIKIKHAMRMIEDSATIIETRNLYQRVDQLNAEIDKIRIGKRLHDYLTDALPLLTAYLKIGPKKHVRRFGENDQDDYNIIHDEDLIRIRIIDDYINVARRFDDINIYRVNKVSNMCPICKETLIIDDEHPSCECGYTPIIIVKEFSSNNVSMTEGYEDYSTFYKIFTFFQAKQIVKIPDKLYEALDKFMTDKYCNQYDFLIDGRPPIGELVRTQELDNRGRRGNTNMRMLINALGKTNYNNFYDHAYLIAKDYWGWTREDLSYMEAELEKDYHTLQLVYYEIKGNRKSSMNGYFRLHKQIQIIQWRMARRGEVVKYVYILEDFRAVKTKKIVVEHENMWAKMINLLNDPEHWPLLTSFG